MKLARYSIGVGDRFGQQGAAQLEAVIKANKAGIPVVPVWNKSHREHGITRTAPSQMRQEADAAVQALGWTGAYFVDADHIGLSNVGSFLDSSDFFTLDVADYVGKPAAADGIAAFVRAHGDCAGALSIPGLEDDLAVTEEDIERIARKYLCAVQEAGRIYRHIAAKKDEGSFVVELSMDETDEPQSPAELFFILAAAADEDIPVQTIAPKFTGRFNKGVDYQGDLDRFAKEFDADICVIGRAVNTFGLPENLKLSVHSGSDKFSIYAPINKALRRHNAGLHLKTAGTTWLEGLIGLASAGSEGLDVAKEIYAQAFARREELCAPYATVIDIDQAHLPGSATVAAWTSDDFVAALRHDPSCKQYNKDLRQLLHVAYRIAAEMGDRYIAALQRFQDIIAVNVTANIYERHLRPLFGGLTGGT